MKKLLKISIISLVLSGFLVGCETTENKTEKEDVTITIVNTNTTMSINLKDKVYVWEQLEVTTNQYNGGIK